VPARGHGEQEGERDDEYRGEGGVGPKSSRSFLSRISQLFNGHDDLRRRVYHIIIGHVDVGLFKSAAAKDVKRF
jgi:hypothetical protein